MPIYPAQIVPTPTPVPGLEHCPPRDRETRFQTLAFTEQRLQEAADEMGIHTYAQFSY